MLTLAKPYEKESEGAFAMFCVRLKILRLTAENHDRNIHRTYLLGISL